MELNQEAIDRLYFGLLCTQAPFRTIFLRTSTFIRELDPDPDKPERTTLPRKP